MKILKVRFQNLNSLTGQWEIDLSDPSYSADGIFAITGPTGAGKSTILDAICLALYGCTPRLNKITKSTNEIMSRHTGECYAEVTFEAQQKRYRCHWSQHRARKKASGELQAPKHEIAHADTGEVLETKLREVADKIEKATGMDYERFTRSMLLAQGGFAAFLQAPPDERAPILEQITGTEIYSHISKRVHERRSEERKELDVLQAEIAGMQILSAEEEQHLTASLQGMSQQEVEAGKLAAKHRTAIHWLEGIGRLESTRKSLQQHKSSLQEKKEAFAPQQNRLQLAQQALEFGPVYTRLDELRKAQTHDDTSLNLCRKEHPDLVEKKKRADEAFRVTREKHTQAKDEQLRTQPLINQARELDVIIAQNTQAAEETQKTIASLNKQKIDLESSQSKDIEQLEAYRKQLQELLDQMKSSQKDAELVEQLAGLSSRFDHLKSLHEQHGTKQLEIKESKKQVQVAQSTARQAHHYLQQEQKKLEDQQQKLTTTEHEYQLLLNGQDLNRLRQRETALRMQEHSLIRARELVATAHQLHRELTDLQRQSTEMEHKVKKQQGEFQEAERRQSDLEKEIALLEENLSLLKRIESLEEARKSLKDGEPCALCGSKDHPFASGNIPTPNKAEQELKLARQSKKKLDKDVSVLATQLAELQKDQQYNQRQQDQCTAKIEEGKRHFGEYRQKISTKIHSAFEDQQLAGELLGIQEEYEKELKQLVAQLEHAAMLEKSLVQLRQAHQKISELLSKANQDWNEARHIQEKAESTLQRLQSEESTLHVLYDEYFTSLQKDVEQYGVTLLSMDSVDATKNQLTIRRNNWLDSTRRQQLLDKSILELEKDIRHRQSVIEEKTQECSRNQEVLSGIVTNRDSLRIKRQELLGSKVPDEEEKRLATLLEKSDIDLEKCRQAQNKAHQDLNNLETKIQELEKSASVRMPQISATLQEFTSCIESAGFANEEAFLAACLPEVERSQLIQQAKELSDEEASLQARERENARLLKEEHEKALCTEPLEELQAKLNQVQEKQKELQLDIGKIKQKINDNNYTKERQAQRIQLIEAKKLVYDRWSMLHDLIGSADGKKFRNFAQGLTFEMMIGHANRQLERMSDRYLLVRDLTEPLELNVIDNYQAGEVRSTKNLSGGESFIVSLSLALGLSSMASQNVRVDSLFLDEGFGTLDEDALETALETLGSLQHDGKIIGVISHVATLKERIGTQIQVTPQTGGRSSISGPGCRAIN
ncbi:AAA family ATPase [Desulfurispira natronophila]|uniref:Exonuclease SbcC n=1 Tax=Desulfurispira natronophila TaxID=682562 RepID=A0A7W7Y3E3_9BACT|nr:SbcC/MukB-like Walker B domain-containing protein [Desulfurispira natronophila]MBB5021371.1 exonuclease SbcC [Desulfurispira natronophila]